MPRRSKLDAIKEKVRAAGPDSVHAQIMESNIIDDDRIDIVNSKAADPIAPDDSAPSAPSALIAELTVTPVDVNVYVPVDENVDVDVHVDVDVTEPEEPLRERRPRFEETHARQTVWVRKDIVAMIDKASGAERGEKTRIINEALDEYFRNRKR